MSSPALSSAQQRQAALARLKAKNKLKQDAQAIKATRKTASFVNITPNQPSSSRNAASGVEAAAKDIKDAPAPLPRDSRLGKYFEYDLSKLHNSKGGFLTEEDGDERQKLIAIQREKARERARIAAGEEPAINPETSPRCAICNSLELDHEFLRVFGVRICKKDKKELPEQYSLLTKTECREDYLLTESELRDPSLLPHLLKPNPHASNYSNMMLYLRMQVEEVAWKKWGGPEGLDEEYEKREDVKRDRKVKKFEEGLKALRRKTKHNAYQVRQDAEHQHEYEDLPTNDPGVIQRTCIDCGHSMDVEVM